MHYILFTTTTCPKCPAFKKFVQENVSFNGEILDERNDSFTDMLVEHNATTAPLFIIMNNQDQELLRATETDEVEEFLQSI